MTKSHLAQKNCERTSTCIINTNKILDFKLQGFPKYFPAKKEAMATFALGHFKYEETNLDLELKNVI